MSIRGAGIQAVTPLVRCNGFRIFDVVTPIVETLFPGFSMHLAGVDATRKVFLLPFPWFALGASVPCCAKGMVPMEKLQCGTVDLLLGVDMASVLCAVLWFVAEFVVPL